MTGTWRHIAAGLFWVAGLCPAGAAVADMRTEALYEAHFGGFHVADVALVWHQGEGRYDIELDARLAGLVSLFRTWRHRTSASGALSAAGGAPGRFDIRRLRSEDLDTTEIRFDGGGPISTVITPPHSDTDGDIDPALLRGAVDPLSAVVFVMNRVVKSGRCDGSVRIYEGRNLFDLTLRHDGEGMLTASNWAPYEGPAIHCKVTLVALAGARLVRAERKGEPVPEITTSIWLAEVSPGGPLLPVRLEGRADSSLFLVHRISADAVSTDIAEGN